LQIYNYVLNNIYVIYATFRLVRVICGSRNALVNSVRLDRILFTVNACNKFSSPCEVIFMTTVRRFLDYTTMILSSDGYR